MPLLLLLLQQPRIRGRVLPGEAVLARRRRSDGGPRGRRGGLPPAEAGRGQPPRPANLPANLPADAAAAPTVEIGHGAAGVAPLLVGRLGLRLEALAAVGRVRQRVLARVVRRRVGVGAQD